VSTALLLLALFFTIVVIGSALVAVNDAAEALAARHRARRR
jgi:hypothetical protein